MGNMMLYVGPVALLLFVGSPVAFGCARSFIESTYTVSMNKTSWENGVKLCRDEGGFMVQIASGEENTAVRQFMMEHNITQAWIGMHTYGHPALESGYVWDLGNSSVQYSNFAPNQPDKEAGFPDERCVEMTEFLIYRWNNARCSQEKFVICEI